MTNEQTILETFRNMRNGASYNLTWQRVCKVYKAHESAGHVVTKRTTAIVRKGVAYDELTSVREGRANGTKPATNQGRTWGEWDIYPTEATHKGARYLRFATVPMFPRPVAVSWFLNGQETTKEKIWDMLTASEKNRPPREVFELKLANLLDLFPKLD